MLSLPEDMLRDLAAVEDAPRAIPVQPAPTTEQMSEVREMLKNAERPLVTKALQVPVCPKGPHGTHG